jgi:hypothetical protein
MALQNSQFGFRQSSITLEAENRGESLEPRIAGTLVAEALAPGATKCGTIRMPSGILAVGAARWNRSAPTRGSRSAARSSALHAGSLLDGLIFNCYEKRS